MRSDSLFTTRCYCETFNVAPRLRICVKPLRTREELGPRVVIAGANSPKSVTATLHKLPFRGWERSLPKTFWVYERALPKLHYILLPISAKATTAYDVQWRTVHHTSGSLTRVQWADRKMFALFPVPLLGQLMGSSVWLTGEEAGDRQLTMRQRDAERKRRYRQRIRQDPQLYQLYREKDHLYSRRYRDKLKKQHQ